MNNLRAIPGQGYEWIVLDAEDRIVATFHALTHSGGEAQRNAETFVALGGLPSDSRATTITITTATVCASSGQHKAYGATADQAIGRLVSEHSDLFNVGFNYVQPTEITNAFQR